MKYDVIHVGGQLAELDNEEDNSRILSEDQIEGSTLREIRIDKVLLEQLSPGGRMWVPLMAKDQGDMLYSIHEVYIIDRNPETLKFKF
mmetsp:Transcript_24801/g.38599  ORF Transcript_24801/g.38599 Transcript_24801/m.38599 type:complete len:88 (+) Transcript_24801:1795-2058(+)